MCRKLWQYRRLICPVCQTGGDYELSVQCCLKPVSLLLVFIFFCETPFLIVVSSMGRRSLKKVQFFSFSGILWTSTFLLINVGVVNQYLSQKNSTIHKTIIHLKELFHHQICIHFSTRYEKNPDVPKDGSPSLSKPIWDLIPPSCLSALWFSTTPLYIQ